MANEWRGRVAAGRLPSRFQLEAAIVAGGLISPPGSLREVVDNSYAHVPSGGLYDRRDLRNGEAILVAAELVELVDEMVIPTSALSTLKGIGHDAAALEVMARLLEVVRPLWLVGATSDGYLETSLLPEDAQSRMNDFDPEERERRLLDLGRRFNGDELKRTGDIAEGALVEHLQQGLTRDGRSDLAEQVARVSLVSDDLGYDITSPTRDGRKLRLESKGTRSILPDIHIFISRNEAECGLSDPDWCLVVSRVHADDSATVIGWLSGDDLAGRLPTDGGASTHWASAQLTLQESELNPGAPRV